MSFQTKKVDRKKDKIIKILTNKFGEDGKEEDGGKEKKGLEPLLLNQDKNEEEEQEGNGKELVAVKPTKKIKATTKR